MAKRKDPTDIGGLTPHPTSYGRSHSERGIGIITDGLQKVGFGRAVLIGRDNQIIAGHATIEAAAAAGITELQIVESDGRKVIAIRRSDLTDEQMQVMGLLDNRAGDFSDWEPGTVEEVWNTQREEIAFMFTEHEVHKIADGSGPDRGDQDLDALPEIRRTSIRVGDLFELGSHRLLCADSETPPSFECVTRGDLVDAVLTDPPYGIASTRKVQKRGKRIAVFDDVAWDTNEPDRWLLSARQVAHPGAAILSFCDAKRISFLWERFHLAGVRPLQNLYWVKPVVPQPRPNFCSSVEAAVFGRVPGGRIRAWNGGGATANCFEAARAAGHERTEHQAQKPMALWSVLLALITHPRHLVLDPFIGSGTTIIAAEQLGRVCYGIDLEPRSCQIVIDRWEQVTGGRAQKVHGAPTRKQKATKRRKKTTKATS